MGSIRSLEPAIAYIQVICHGPVIATWPGIACPTNAIGSNSIRSPSPYWPQSHIKASGTATGWPGSGRNTSPVCFGRNTTRALGPPSSSHSPLSCSKDSAPMSVSFLESLPPSHKVLMKITPSPMFPRQIMYPLSRIPERWFHCIYRHKAVVYSSRRVRWKKVQVSVRQHVPFLNSASRRPRTLHR